MEPVTLTALSSSITPILKKSLSDSLKKFVARESVSIIQKEPTSQDRTMAVFENVRKGLQRTLTIQIFMATTLFVVFVGMIIAAIVTGLVLGKSNYTIIFGGVSASSLLGTLIWRPFKKTLQASMTMQRLEIIIAGLEEEWASCKNIEDKEKCAECIREANKAALVGMAEIKP